ncbi:hypothetical protein BD626DRAFT_563628 [Schizophyllum amplum]|uniref:Mitochondrial intermembrane space import and assembly protein 40 n=1 Tax=Schizophyllum amplum TaxID=97359 RepID=A0A550CYQ7_9AGAR|nr:hypothetical protein BD626DRAFT_563628 [Auriculariopsis ampla]
MFARLTRLPLRRCIHTSAAPASAPWARSRVAYGVGAAVTASYLAWRLQADRIALDSVEPPLTASDKVAPASDATPEEIPFPADAEPSSASTSEESAPPSESSETSGDAESTVEAKAEEAQASGGAYDPVTGEINWDCPCLGGMAQGPCGEQFKAAFSCFVYSEDEPKGINCVDAFRTMQECFREHPEVYADEIGDDDEEPEAPAEPERKFRNIHSDDVDF